MNKIKLIIIFYFLFNIFGIIINLISISYGYYYNMIPYIMNSFSFTLTLYYCLKFKFN